MTDAICQAARASTPAYSEKVERQIAAYSIGEKWDLAEQLANSSRVLPRPKLGAPAHDEVLEMAAFLRSGGCRPVFPKEQDMNQTKSIQGPLSAVEQAIERNAQAITDLTMQICILGDHLADVLPPEYLPYPEETDTSAAVLPVPGVVKQLDALTERVRINGERLEKLIACLRV